MIIIENDKIKSIFKGSIERKIYKYDKYRNYIYDDSRVIKWENIHEGLLDKPPFYKHEYVYINEIDKRVQIIDTARSTNNEIVYYTSKVIETIEDEKTEKSLKEAEQQLAEYLEIREKREVEKKELEQKELEQKRNKKWYKFWK